jgi:hypothetical protein
MLNRFDAINNLFRFAHRPMVLGEYPLNERALRRDLEKLIAEIQLDALKCGLNLAVKICKEHPDYADMGATNYQEAIIDKANKLTEKDLT